MNGKNPFLVLNKDYSEAVRWITTQLEQSGLHLVQTFDLKNASFDHSLCSCPHHGTEQCDCQMGVLLVYETGQPPASLVAHGHDGQTWFSLVETPQQRVQAHFETVILEALSPQTLALKLMEMANDDCKTTYR